MNSYHDAKMDFEMFVIIICFVALNVLMFFYIKGRFNEIKYQEKVENLGNMLVTKYNIAECKNKLTKTGEIPVEGTCGISPDLRDVLWMNDWIYVEGYGKLRVNTLTHRNDKTTGLPLHRTIDVYTDDIKEAIKHGAKRRRVYLIKQDEK